MMWTYLNTEPKAVASYYRRIMSISNPPEITVLFDLPTISQIEKAAALHSNGFKDTVNIASNFETIEKNIRLCAEL
jgi:hypothetical protein